MEEDDNNDAAVKAAIRSAKKSARPAKIGVSQAALSKLPKKKEKKKSSAKVASRGTGSAFERDLGQNMSRGEGVRAKKGDGIAGMGKKGGKRKG